jgi:hypothetical protein
MLEERSSWVFLNENLTRDQLANVLAHHRFGIHVRENEQFGISVAEMVSAGCIPFVPSQGGQIEIIGNIPALQFNNIDEAVTKIVNVMNDLDLQMVLTRQLSQNKDSFNSGQFCKNLLAFVESYLVSK